MIVDELKKSLLMQAFQGNLSVTDSVDTDVEVSSKRIAQQKEKLIENYKVRNEPIYKNLSGEEKIFNIPLTWKWYRIGELGIFKKGPFGSSLTKSMFIKDCEDAIKVYEQKNAIQKDINLGDYYISKKYYEEKMKSFEVNSGDIIVSCAGTIGETYVIPKIFRKGIINQALMKMTMVKEININYFLLYFDFILKKESNNLSSGSAIKNIPPFDIFKQLPIPLPPIEEQQRIVDKIEELFAILDELKPIELELRIIKEKFPIEMKKSILSNLFKENENILKEKLNTIVNFLNIKNSENGEYNYLEVNYLRENIEPKKISKGKYVSKDSLAILVDGENSGEIFKISENGYLGSTLKLLKLSENVLEKYFVYYLMLKKDYFKNNKRGSAIPHLDKKLFLNSMIYLPPIEEQQKIVNKIEQLLSLCNDIEKIIIDNSSLE